MAPLILALALGQSMNLNTQPLVCMDEGLYCRADKRTAFELNCSGAGVSCAQVGGRINLTVSSAGGGGGYDGGKVGEAFAADASVTAQSLAANPTDCAGGEFANAIDAFGNLTCAVPSGGGKVAESYMADASITAQVAGVAFSTDAGYRSQFAGVADTAFSADASAVAIALAANPADCSANQYANAIAASGALTCAQVAYSQVSGTPTIPTDISGAGYITKTTEASLSNEFALGTLATGVLVNTTTTGIPTIKAANTCTNQFPRSDNASGVWTCASIATADLPTVTVAKGGTGQTTITTNQVYVGTAADTLTAKTIPSCSNATTSKLLYDNSTQTWSCGTDQTGGGGSTRTVYAANGSDTPIAVATTDPGVTLVSKTLTVAAGDIVTVEAWVDVMNNSGATKTYTLRCRTDSTTLISLADSTTLAAATTRGIYRFRCTYAVRSTGSTRLRAELTRTPTSAANTAQTVVERAAWNTSASDWTGSRTFDLRLSSSATGATQNAIVTHYQVTHQANNP